MYANFVSLIAEKKIPTKPTTKTADKQAINKTSRHLVESTVSPLVLTESPLMSEHCVTVPARSCSPDDVTTAVLFKQDIKQFVQKH